MGIVLPKLCRTQGDEAEPIDQGRLLSLLLFGALLLIVASTILAPWIVPFVLGRSYISSAPVVQVLIWATPFMFWNYLLISNLIANNAERYIFIGSTIALAVNLVTNFMLIPRFGYMAAAFNTIATEMMLLGANMFFCNRASIFVFPAWSSCIVSSTAGVLAGAVLWQTKSSELQFLAGVFLVGSPLIMLSPLKGLILRTEVKVAATR
jgi:O-antigen/teichoic acid export membrane protein